MILKSVFKKELNNFKKLVDNELLNIYPNGPNLIKNPINYVVTGGKRLRPSLCLLICCSFNNQELHQHAQTSEDDKEPNHDYNLPP